MPESIYWYDLETTGTDPILDRPIQFAGVRTDLDLNVVGEPDNFLGQPGDDVVPSPEAMRVTGILLSDLAEQGITEAAFAREVYRRFIQPETCVAGYNSLRFDDEFTRQMFYRNFYDPYAREWQGGNSRWDVIDLVRMTHALRPDGIEWVMNDGVPSFRLELLTAANGITHEDAHDALADVYATIDLARLVKDKQPRLYQYLFDLRAKSQVLRQLYPLGKSPVIHVSGMYPARRSCLAVVLPLCQHPTNSNGIICFDLAHSPDNLISARADEIERLVFSRSEDLGEDDERIPLKTIHINRCPAIAPITTLMPSDATRLGIDLAQCEDHQRRLQTAAGVVEKISDVFGSRTFDERSDPDHLLYGGRFFGRNDQSVMAELREASSDSLAGFAGRFDDERLDEMLFRYQARNYPDCLDESESAQWLEFKRARKPDIETALSEVAGMLAHESPAYLVELQAFLESKLCDVS